MLAALAIALGLCLTRGHASIILSPVISATTIISNTPPVDASQPVAEAFISFAIEFGHFPDYAGNRSTPNTFSNTLLDNIADITGTKPYIRVGGTSADEAVYNVSLESSVHRPQQPTLDIPTFPTDMKYIEIGNTFFEGYNNFLGSKFSHGFNLGLAGISVRGWESLLKTIPVACQALEGKLLYWEYGNEPDLYSNPSNRGKIRNNGWDDEEYVNQWLNGTRQIKATLDQACSTTDTADTGYLGPSFWSPDDSALTASGTWQAGLNADNNVKLFSFHNYIASESDPSVSLQGTLMNHSVTMASIAKNLQGYDFLQSTGPPLVITETNSLYDTGLAGVSNVFGAALWTLDYSLWCASQNITRIHMQQGNDFLYDSWQAIDTPKAAKGTRPPYYGNIAAAASIGNYTSKVKIANFPLGSDTDVAYAAYVNDMLVRITVINMQAFDSCNGQLVRPAKTYQFTVPRTSSTKVGVRRLLADGSDSTSGISFDGFSYEYDLQEGMPVLLSNITRGETLPIIDGVATVRLMDSSAAILDFL